jgi:hypothetical protein
LQAKLADMGLSKHLENDVSSYQDTGLFTVFECLGFPHRSCFYL